MSFVALRGDAAQRVSCPRRLSERFRGGTGALGEMLLGVLKFGAGYE